MRSAYAFVGALVVVIACGRTAAPPVVPGPPPPPADASTPPPPIAPKDAAPPPSLADASVTAPPAPPPSSARLQFRGVNLSGAEFGASVPGVHGRDYLWPSPADADYFLARGMNHFRIPFRHKRLQPVLRGPLDEVEWTRMRTLVGYITGKGASVAIEPHESFRFDGRLMTEAEIADFWGRVAVRFKDDPRVQINVTNEPHDMTTEAVVLLNNATLREIRRVGFKGLVLVPGNGFTGAYHWLARWYGTPNGTAWPGVTDPGGNMAIEVHQYLDTDGSGGGKECVSESVGVERLTAFTTWLRANGRTGWLGEIAAPDTPICRIAVTRALAFLEANRDTWLGFDWWGAGSWAFASTYMLSIGPTPPGQPDKPQMEWLKPFLSTAAPPCTP